MNPYELKPMRRRLRLGRGGVVYVAATALILGAAIYTQANLLFWSFGLMVGGLVVSVILTGVTLRKIVLRRVSPSHGVAGEPLVLRYQITNRSRLAVFGLTVYETWGRGSRGWKKTGPASAQSEQLIGRPIGWLLHLGPQQTAQAEAICWPRKRGAIDFERIVLDCGFPFGIVHKTIHFDAPGQVLVYPHLYRINRRLLFSLANVQVTAQRQIERSGGTEDFYGLRPYRAGDNVKLIDWRRTAKTGQMVARELTQPTPPRVMILLDLRTPKPVIPPDLDPQRASEQAVSLAASLICDAYLSGYQIGLEIVGYNPLFTVHHSLPHRTRMIDALAQLNRQELDPAAEPVSDKPSVIIHLGHAAQLSLPHASAAALPLILGSDEFEQYIQKSPHDSGDLLRRTPLNPSKRSQLAKRPPPKKNQ